MSQPLNPSESAVRRALARAERGVTLDAVEAETLLHARGLGEGEPLDRLLTAAGRVRDAGLASAGRGGVVTYSRKVFIPLTHLCRDRCHYCTFATVPGRLPAPFLTVDEVVDLARRGAMNGFQDPGALLQMGSGEQGFPFLADAPLTPAYLAWTVVWIAMIWGLTALSFQRRDV